MGKRSETQMGTGIGCVIDSKTRQHGEWGAGGEGRGLHLAQADEGTGGVRGSMTLGQALRDPLVQPLPNGARKRTDLFSVRYQDSDFSLPIQWVSWKEEKRKQN